MPVYVIGHKNPDTDSICSSIAYAHFLSRTHIPEAVAACCGDVNPRTQFVLKRAGLFPPRLLLDVRPTLARVCKRNVVSAREDEAFFEVYRRMQARRLHSVPVLDTEGRLVGMLTLSRLLELLLPEGKHFEKTRLTETSLDLICRSVSGHFHHGVDTEKMESLFLSVGAMSAPEFLPRLHAYPAEQSIIVMGDRPTIQTPTIAFGARCMVITGGCSLAPALLEQAHAKGVSVISSPWDTATTTLLIQGAKGIGSAIDRDFLKFKESMLVQAVRKTVHPLSQHLFPVVNDAGHLTGVVSKDDLASPEPIQLVLVDHNELAQAVTGADEAEILEVLDHHRVGGGLMSREPIRFQNDTVGSTCTMVTRCFKREGMVPPPDIAICLAAGIISDTLHLSSPTTCAVDREMLQWLGDTCAIDTAAFAEDFFSVGSALQMLSPADALRMDCKAYTEGPWNMAVAQIEEMGFESFYKHQATLTASLADLMEEKRLDFACLLVTDIGNNNSLLLAGGAERILEAISFPRLEPQLFKLDGVVSRKKQLLPSLARTLAGLEKD
jgi:manganese-dependent inorganic pyrophosphatase